MDIKVTVLSLQTLSISIIATATAVENGGGTKRSVSTFEMTV